MRRKRFTIVAGAVTAFCAMTIAAVVAWRYAHTPRPLDRADQYELLSLDPTFPQPPTSQREQFHGWRVIGRTWVTDSTTRGKLSAALAAGAGEPGLEAAGCFNPRHGVRFMQDGKEIHLVICFECCQVKVYSGEEQIENYLVSRSPQLVFDDVLKSASVRLAE